MSQPIKVVVAVLVVVVVLGLVVVVFCFFLLLLLWLFLFLLLRLAINFGQNLASKPPPRCPPRRHQNLPYMVSGFGGDSRNHLSRRHLSISRINQLLLPRFLPNFKGRLLGTSLTDANCHGDIFLATYVLATFLLKFSYFFGGAFNIMNQIFLDQTSLDPSFF